MPFRAMNAGGRISASISPLLFGLIRRMGGGRRLLGVCLLFAVLATAGCTTGRVNLWPAYFRETRRVESEDGPKHLSTTEVLYPFFESHSDGEERWHVVRPLYNAQRDAEGEVRVQYLWPLGLFFDDGDAEVHFRLFPFWGWHRTWAGSVGKPSVHAHLLQLIRWGADARHGPYFAVFPIAGVTHGVLGPTWSFLLFPLYSHYRRGDYVRHDFPWPVLGYGRAPEGKAQMYRLWPFYVFQRTDDSRGFYERHDLLWPLVRWGKLDRGGRYYHRVIVTVPFFSTVRTYDRYDRLVAHRTSVLGFYWTHDSRAQPEREGIAALWSLFKSTDSPRSEEFRILPFYWRSVHYRTARREPESSWSRTRVLWPILWLDSDKLHPGVHHRGTVVAPFYWDYKETRDPGEPEEAVGRRITLWPLATREKDLDGDVHFWVLSRGWQDPTKGYKRNYRAFLDFFQYHSAPDGLRETRLLSRLYHHRRGPRGRYLSVGGLFTYDTRGEAVGEAQNYVSLLFGLVKYSWQQQRGRWRLLYVPLGPKLTEREHERSG